MQSEQAAMRDTADREIVFTRLLDAPRELVFKVWTEPAHIAQWWGPNGFTNTVHEMEVKPGGVWRFMMHGPDGTDYPNCIFYHEVTPPSRLVYSHGGHSEPFEPEFHVVASFDVEGDKTRLTMRLLFNSVEACNKVKEFGAVEGGQQTLERLAAYLAAHRDLR